MIDRGRSLTWDSWIGEPPEPPQVAPESDRRNEHDSLLINIISLLLSANVDVLKDVERILVKGCDSV